MKSEWLDMQYNKDIDSWFIIEEGQARFILNGEWFDLYISEDRSFLCRIQYLNTCDHLKENQRIQVRTHDAYKIEV
jgi:hypothetical protein